MRWCKTRQFLSSGISGLQKLVHLQPLGIQLRLEHPKGSFHTTAYQSSFAPKKSTKNLSIWKGAVMLDPLLACDPRLRGILINVSCFPTLTCRSPVLTLTISLGTLPRISSSWAETYFPMFNNSTSPQTHTVPQTSYTSEECPRPLMRPGFPNAKTPFNRFLLPQSPSSDKNLVTNYFRFHFH